MRFLNKLIFVFPTRTHLCSIFGCVYRDTNNYPVSVESRDQYKYKQREKSETHRLVHARNVFPLNDLKSITASDIVIRPKI